MFRIRYSVHPMFHIRIHYNCKDPRGGWLSNPSFIKLKIHNYIYTEWISEYISECMKILLGLDPTLDPDSLYWISEPGSSSTPNFLWSNWKDVECNILTIKITAANQKRAASCPPPQRRPWRCFLWLNSFGHKLNNCTKNLTLYTMLLFIVL